MANHMSLRDRTCRPECVCFAVTRLLAVYNSTGSHTFEEKHYVYIVRTSPIDPPLPSAQRFVLRSVSRPWCKIWYQLLPFLHERWQPYLVDKARNLSAQWFTQVSSAVLSLVVVKSFAQSMKHRSTRPEYSCIKSFIWLTQSCAPFMSVYSKVVTALRAANLFLLHNLL